MNFSPRRNSRFILYILFLTVFLVGISTSVFAQNTYQTWVHTDGSGKPDSGTSSTSGGVTTVTYKDGWTDTTEPDNATNPPGTKTTVKDDKGRIRQIIKKNAGGGVISNYFVDYENNLIIQELFDKTGKLIQRKKFTGDPTKPPEKTYEWDDTKKTWVPIASSFDGNEALILTAVFLAGVLVGAGMVAMRKGNKSRAAKASAA
jgi:hypothetical protein